MKMERLVKEKIRERQITVNNKKSKPEAIIFLLIYSHICKAQRLNTVKGFFFFFCLPAESQRAATSTAVKDSTSITSLCSALISLLTWRNKRGKILAWRKLEEKKKSIKDVELFPHGAAFAVRWVLTKPDHSVRFLLRHPQAKKKKKEQRVLVENSLIEKLQCKT